MSISVADWNALNGTGSTLSKGAGHESQKYYCTVQVSRAVNFANFAVFLSQKLTDS